MASMPLHYQFLGIRKDWEEEFQRIMKKPFSFVNLFSTISQPHIFEIFSFSFV